MSCKILLELLGGDQKKVDLIAEEVRDKGCKYLSLDADECVFYATVGPVVENDLYEMWDITDAKDVFTKIRAACVADGAVSEEVFAWELDNGQFYQVKPKVIMVRVDAKGG